MTTRFNLPLSLHLPWQSVVLMMLKSPLFVADAVVVVAVARVAVVDDDDGRLCVRLGQLSSFSLA